MARGQYDIHPQGGRHPVPLLDPGTPYLIPDISLKTTARRPRPAARPFILASASPRRRILLRQLGVPFRIIPSNASERTREKRPRRFVVELALRKARDVARRHPQAVVLGADTIVVCGGEIIGKPRSRSDSRRILELLNGRWQEVYTGIAVAWEGGKKSSARAVKSRVLARRLDREKISRLAGKHPDKAGAYAVQDKDDPFIERIEGDYSNVVGLPLDATRELLRGHLTYSRGPRPRPRLAPEQAPA